MIAEKLQTLKCVTMTLELNIIVNNEGCRQF